MIQKLTRSAYDFQVPRDPKHWQNVTFTRRAIATAELVLAVDLFNIFIRSAPHLQVHAVAGTLAVTFL
jgi:hypothetical protein